MDSTKQTSLKNPDTQENPLLLCTKCRTLGPSMRLKKFNGSIVTDISCKYCKQDYIVDLGEYLSLMKQYGQTNHYCTNKPHHSKKVSESHCASCTKWLCEKCILDHQTYPELSLHKITTKQTIINYECTIHKGKEYQYFCDECKISLCKVCNDNHKKKSHSIITKETLTRAVHQFNLQDSLNSFKFAIKQNADNKNNLYSLLEAQNQPFTNLKKDLLSSYEKNEKGNMFIIEFLKVAFESLQKFSKSPSFELIDTIKNTLIPNNKEVPTDEEELEKKCKNLIDYWMNNYIVNTIHKIIYPDGDSYDGELVNGLCEGYGKYKFSDGRQYQGFFKNDERNGKGKMTYPSGDTYDGEWVNGLYEGIGTLKYADGAIYQGNFKNDEQNGKGKMIGLSGDTYEGEWKNGICEGFGVFKYADGAIYEGYHKNDERNGKGKMTYPSGDLFDGEWKNGLCEGFGIFKYADGRQYQGNFKNDERSGKGQMTYPSGDSYDGEWANGFYDGIGILKYADGNQYQGHFKNNKRNGKGKMTYTSGESYDGEWLKDMMEGYGVLKYADGRQYQGHFKNNKQKGKGTMIYPSGDLYEGEWLKDSIEGYGIFKYADGRQYQGYFKNNKQKGKGLMTWKSGASYNGEWVNGLFEGYGTYKWANGKEYQGYFKSGTRLKIN